MKIPTNTTLLRGILGLVVASSMTACAVASRYSGSTNSLPKPTVALSSKVNGSTVWQQSHSLVSQNPSRAPTDCSVNFDDTAVLTNIADDQILSSFIMSPWWIQSCSANSEARVRPHNLDHFHLNAENLNCQVGFDKGKLQEDNSCKILSLEELKQEPYYLGSMNKADVIELKVYDSNNTAIAFDLKRIRILGNKRPVRLCYKPIQEISGPWITSEVNELTEPGLWGCWNNMTAGYWDVSQWAGNVSSVRIIAAEGVINFSIDDILIGVTN